MWLGEFDLSSLVDFKFTTRGTTGAPTTLSGTPAVSVYKSNSTTESTAGVTLTADFDARTGLNHVRIDTSADGTFYATATDFQVVITTGTVGGTSVVGETVGHFTIRNRAGLKPATAGRTLVVDAAGLADANAVKLGPSGSGTAQTARDIGASVLLSNGTSTGQIILTSGVVTANATQLAGQTITAAAGVTFPTSVASPTNITAGTITTVTNLTNAPTAGDFTATMKTSAQTAADAAITANATIIEIEGETDGISGLSTGVNVSSINGVATTSVTTVNANIGTVQPAPTLAQLNTSIMQNTTPGDFSVPTSIGNAIYTAVAPGASGGHMIAGSNAATTVNITGNLSGSVGSVTNPVAITSNIKTNQALTNFRFLMTDSSTHAPKTGLAVTVTRGIDGGAQAGGTLSAVTEIANGEYRVDFGAGDLNGKVIVLRATATGADDLEERIITQP